MLGNLKDLGYNTLFVLFECWVGKKKSHTIFLLESRDFLRPKRQHAYIFRLCYLMYSIIPRYLSRPFSLIGCMKTFFYSPWTFLLKTSRGYTYSPIYRFHHPFGAWCLHLGMQRNTTQHSDIRLKWASTFSDYRKGKKKKKKKQTIQGHITHIFQPNQPWLPRYLSNLLGISGSLDRPFPWLPSPYLRS